MAIVAQLVTQSPLVPPGGTGGSYMYSSGFIDAARNTVTVTIAAPEIPAQAAAAPPGAGSLLGPLTTSQLATRRRMTRPNAFCYWICSVLPVTVAARSRPSFAVR